MKLQGMGLEQRINLAWQQKTGEVDAGWKKFLGMTHLSHDVVAREFDVTTKTISRWRSQQRKEAQV